MTLSLNDLGWAPFFSNQPHTHSTLTPFRIIEVHRDRLIGLGQAGSVSLVTPHGPTGSFAVGDWVLADPELRVQQLLERRTELSRRAGVGDTRLQLIAANVDVMFITSSCNADFKAARLERYLALAQGARCYPVVILTKADRCDDPERFRKTAEKLAPNLVVLTVNAHDASDLAEVAKWCPKGQTGVLLGSSGVGKTTLMNGLTAGTEATQSIREDDAKGRHTTTARTLRVMTNGGLLVDTPGIRSLRLTEPEDGLETVFSDLQDLAAQCKFNNCRHESEPGCAVRAACEAGTLAPERVERWRKLLRDEGREGESTSQFRARDKSFGKMVREVKRIKKGRKGY